MKAIQPIPSNERNLFFFQQVRLVPKLVFHLIPFELHFPAFSAAFIHNWTLTVQHVSQLSYFILFSFVFSVFLLRFENQFITFHTHYAYDSLTLIIRHVQRAKNFCTRSLSRSVCFSVFLTVSISQFLFCFQAINHI